MLGSGQLGRMFAIAARRLGYHVHVYSPERHTPAGQVADREFSAAYDDTDKLTEFARSVDVVSYEFENVPASVTGTIEPIVPIRPGPLLLHISQDRIREKSSLRDAGFPVPAFVEVAAEADLQPAVEQIGTPCVLKTATCGYDGKGQVKIEHPQELEAAWHEIGCQPAILEAWVQYACEVSVIIARSVSGETEVYGPIRNVHTNHILDTSTIPAGIPAASERQAITLAQDFARQFQLEGVVCLEFFLLEDERLLINEIAPRPHNSGHLTIDAHVTCQFEQQVRAICGLKLGSSRLLQPAAMANLLGDLWQASPLGHPNWEHWSQAAEVKLHLYGKDEPRVGRKMGHLTCVADTTQQALARVTDAREQLVRADRVTVQEAR